MEKIRVATASQLYLGARILAFGKTMVVDEIDREKQSFSASGETGHAVNPPGFGSPGLAGAWELIPPDDPWWKEIGTTYSLVAKPDGNWGEVGSDGSQVDEIFLLPDLEEHLRDSLPNVLKYVLAGSSSRKAIDAVRFWVAKANKHLLPEDVFVDEELSSTEHGKRVIEGFAENSEV